MSGQACQYVADDQAGRSDETEQTNGGTIRKQACEPWFSLGGWCVVSDNLPVTMGNGLCWMARNVCSVVRWRKCGKNRDDLHAKVEGGGKQQGSGAVRQTPHAVVGGRFVCHLPDGPAFEPPRDRGGRLVPVGLSQTATMEDGLVSCR